MRQGTMIRVVEIRRVENETRDHDCQCSDDNEAAYDVTSTSSVRFFVSFLIYLYF